MLSAHIPAEVSDQSLLYGSAFCAIVSAVRALLHRLFGRAEAPIAPPAPAPAPTVVTPKPTLSLFEDRLEGAHVQYAPSPNTPGLFAAAPDTALVHYTATLGLESALRQLTATRGRNSVSAHIVVDRDGSYYQLLPFSKVAWHAGESVWQGRSGLNQFAIGIELINAGRLETRAGQEGLFTWYGAPVRAEDAERGTHRNETAPSWWHRYPLEQVEATHTLCQLLVGHYPIEWILGHEEVSPGRKVDPGPAFPLDQLRADLGRPLRRSA